MSQPTSEEWTKIGRQPDPLVDEIEKMDTKQFAVFLVVIDTHWKIAAEQERLQGLYP